MAMDWFKRNWRKLGATLLAIEPLWRGFRWVVGRGGDTDFIISRIEDPSWVGKMINWLINPPAWFPALLALAAIVLIFWDIRKNRQRPAATLPTDGGINRPTPPSTPSGRAYNRIKGQIRHNIHTHGGQIRVIDATISVLEASGDAKDLAAHVDVYRLFRQGELIALCKTALANGPMTNRQLALYIMRAKGMNTDDVVLAKAVASRLINALGQQRRRRAIVGAQPGKRLARTWRLKD